MADWEDETRVTAPEPKRPAGGDHAYLIVLAGSSVGEMHKLTSDRTLLGRSSQAQVRILEEGISRGHAEIVPRGDMLVLRDLGSTNGTYCNGDRVTEHVLRDGDKIQIGSTTILKFTFHDSLDENFQRQMFEAALRDGLTKAFNRKYFVERLEAEFAYSSRHQTMLSLVLFDIDHFKQVNDKYGHPAGDYALVGLAQIIAAAIRQEDIFARYGGEEFAVLCRGVDLEGARAFGERIRVAVEAKVFHYEKTPIILTISVGVASFSPATDSPTEMIRLADEALYEAKHTGRNRVCAAKPQANS